MAEFDPSELVSGLGDESPPTGFDEDLWSVLEDELERTSGGGTSLETASGEATLVDAIRDDETKSARKRRAVVWVGAAAAVVAVVVGVSVQLAQDEDGGPFTGTEEPVVSAPVVPDPVAPTSPPTTAAAADPGDFEVGAVFEGRSLSFFDDGEVWERGEGTTWNRLDPTNLEVVETLELPVAASMIDFSDVAIWARGDDGRLLRIDPVTLEVAAAIEIDVDEFFLGADAVWVVDIDAGIVTRIDPETDAVVATIEVGDDPQLAYTGADAVWVNLGVDGLLNSPGAVGRIDPATNTLVATIEAPPTPAAFNVGHGAVWARSSGAFGPLVRIDPATNTVVASIEVGEEQVSTAGGGIAIGQTAVWHAHRDLAADGVWTVRLSRIDPATNTVVATIDLGEMDVTFLGGGVVATDTAVWAANKVIDGWVRVDVPAGT